MITNYLFLEEASLKSWSRSESWSLRGLPVREGGDSDIGTLATPATVLVGFGSPSPWTMESAFSYEARILWTRISRVSCEEDGTFRWIWSCLASSLPCVSSFTRFFCSQSPIFSVNMKQNTLIYIWLLKLAYCKSPTYYSKTLYGET